MRDIAVIYREPAKRKQKLKDAALDESNQSSDEESAIRQIAGDVIVIDNEGAVLQTTVLALCPTRWCVRARALQRVLDLWPSIRRAVNQLLTENCRRKTKIKLESLKKSFQMLLNSKHEKTKNNILKRLILLLMFYCIHGLNNIPFT